MAKRNKSQAERNTTSKRKRSFWDLFKFRCSGKKSPPSSNVGSDGAHKSDGAMAVMGSDNNPGFTHPKALNFDVIIDIDPAITGVNYSGTIETAAGMLPKTVIPSNMLLDLATMDADNQVPVTNPANTGANYGGTVETAAGMPPKTLSPAVNMPASNEPPAHGDQTLAPPDLLTLADINNESKMSPVRKAALQTWKSLHKLTEVIEPFLEGTPFEGPVSVFNVISSAAELFAFSSNGFKVISGSDDRTVRLWNAVTGEQEMIMNGHTEEVYSVAFSPDGRKVMSGSDNNTVNIWDVATGNRIIEIVGHTATVYSVAFSPVGANIVSGSADKTICIWNASTGAKLKQIDGHSRGVRSVAFSFDGVRLVSGSADHTVCIWDAVTGDKVNQMNGHRNEVNSVAFSSNGSWVVSGSDDKTICIWDAASGR
ncbi:hypothetical protein GYMLUDRAFT_250293 [Collybiopsis luxurians FD-317 M1]|uniref:WD40 repeat-like protein n=1 Tax=Collybiopsis luxurians FD-317 M1 TaxID=944289 RepID=A0A0D0BG03_9AGAR|nr:hypothetical protein GYMLUDRAFT_250293 [Collybiopsis luxurians FD-317 M1]